MAVYSNDYGIPHHPERFQDVTNQSWPPPEVARRLSDRQDGIDVRVRVVLSGDGEVWLDGRATRWHGRHVFAYVLDDRLRLGFVWVDAGDVQRR
jgi:hypothetical protein